MYVVSNANAWGKVELKKEKMRVQTLMRFEFSGQL